MVIHVTKPLNLMHLKQFNFNTMTLTLLGYLNSVPVACDSITLKDSLKCKSFK